MVTDRCISVFIPPYDGRSCFIIFLRRAARLTAGCRGGHEHGVICAVLVRIADRLGRSR
jgi:hypothetical protein